MTSEPKKEFSKTEKFDNPLQNLATDLKKANLGRTWKARTASNEKSIFQLPELDTIRRLSEKNIANTLKKGTEIKPFRIRTGKVLFEYLPTEENNEMYLKKQNNELANDLNNLLDLEEINHEFIIGELLGEGSYSKVFKVLVPENGSFLAAKQILIPELESDRYSLQVKSLSSALK